jgi:hypothetical protein
LPFRDGSFKNRIFARMRIWLTAAVMMAPFCLFAQNSDQTKADTPAVNQKPADTLLIRQFDGSTLHIVCSGNLYISYCETLDGYTVLLDKIGMYEYARSGRKGDLVPNGSPAKDEDQRTDQEKRAVNNLHKHLRYTGSTLEKLQEKEKKKNDDPVIIKRYKRR